MLLHRIRLLPSAAAAVAAGIAGTVGSAAAQDISLNYEILSSLEEPLATEIGDVTFVLTGLLDTPLTLDLSEDRGATRGGLVGNFEIGARTQLPNRWRVRMTYFGQYATGWTSASGPNDGYTDKAALSVGGVWGTVLGGNVSGVVREQTRRVRGAGNASLAFDDVLGGLEDRSISYVGRFGPWVAGAVVDADGAFDLGAVFQRPIGNKDYRLTVRYGEGAYTATDGSDRFDSRSLSSVGELVYGSTLLDIGAGYERLSSDGPNADRWYVSLGARTKAGMLSLSLEGHYGRIEGADEVSVALGLQYDLARGLSANFGLNHAEADVTLGGVSLVGTLETKAVFSLRYSF